MPASATQRLLHEHAAISEAIDSRLPDLAEQRMREHLCRFRPSVALLQDFEQE